MTINLHAASSDGANPPQPQSNASYTPLLKMNPKYDSAGYSLSSLPKSWTFTHSLPPDAAFPSPLASHQTPRGHIGPRQVRDAIFTWVRPEQQKDPELLAVSPAAMQDLQIKPSEASTTLFRDFAAGNEILGWDANDPEEGGYPWAQCYGGFQFGQWAGQLGDGRAISLFETKADQGAETSRYEIQLKGAGMTPYSRFADGKAVLRSSIREFVVSEALNALGIPTTRALALTLLPHSRVRRETMEPGAIVVRFAQSWLRLGNFDILRARGDRKLVRQLATYIAEDVFRGWDKLPGRIEDDEKVNGTETAAEEASEKITGPKEDDSKPDIKLNPQSIANPSRNIPPSTYEGPSPIAENRFARLYREIVRRNAATVAHWQAYGFTNGVLNTDNTSIFGLSIDFGPFAFLDNFDPSYTPNHDDHMLRYSYRNQPTIIWWNLTRLGEALGELMGAGAEVDQEDFVKNGLTDGQSEKEKELIYRAETIIHRAGEEYKAVFLTEYKRLMSARIGLKTFKDSDFDELYSEVLDIMERYELDFTHFFRRLSNIKMADVASEDARLKTAAVFFHHETDTSSTSATEGRKQIATWLERWQNRVVEDWGAEADADQARITAMKRVNPNFIPRGYILDELIQRVEKGGERDVLQRVMHMALNPFEDEWTGKAFDGVKYEGDRVEEVRWTGDVPKPERAMQCSCSS